MSFNKKIVIRGGGDIATGVAQKFFRAGFDVIVLEIPAPTAIRRTVALCEAAYDGKARVEDMICKKAESLEHVQSCLKSKNIPLLIDPLAESVSRLNPTAVIDAILAKRNLGTDINMAPITIALGPGFFAGDDVHVVVETKRRHDLGRLIFQGSALADTGIPGEIGGESNQRVLRAPISGIVKGHKRIGEIAEKGDVVFTVFNQPVHAPFRGVLRGLIRDGTAVPKGMKTADIDPRVDIDVHTISDKARSIGGAALEAYFYLRNKFEGDM